MQVTLMFAFLLNSVCVVKQLSQLGKVVFLLKQFPLNSFSNPVSFSAFYTQGILLGFREAKIVVPSRNQWPREEMQKARHYSDVTRIGHQ